MKNKMLRNLLALLFFMFLSANTTKEFNLSSNNWTTCDSFLNNTVFESDSVVDIDWKIFYFWSPEMETTYNIRFSRPTKTLVDRFRVELDKEIKPPVNWNDAEFFMETSIDFSALFIRTDKSGVYRIIPSSAFEYTSVPMLIFGLKVVKPGYLGIANCKHRLCYALAPADKMPQHYELESAARTLGFFNEYNRSLVTEAPPYSSTASTDLEEDYGDNDDPDMEMDPNKLEIF